MITQRTLSVTEARDKLFKILKMVDTGDEIIIHKKDSNQKYKISSYEESPKQDKKIILRELAKTKFKSKPIDELTDILAHRLDP